MKSNTSKLKTVLKANGIFSALSGLTILLFGGQLAEIFGMSSALVLRVVGAGLILFSASVFMNAFRNVIKENQIRLIIWQDWAWVLGSGVIIFLGLFDLTFLAYEAIAFVALIVATFAILQGVFLRRLNV